MCGHCDNLFYDTIDCITVDYMILIEDLEQTCVTALQADVYARKCFTSVNTNEMHHGTNGNSWWPSSFDVSLDELRADFPAEEDPLWTTILPRAWIHPIGH